MPGRRREAGRPSWTTAPPGRTELTIGVDFSWTDFYVMHEADRPVGAYYTVREHRPAAGELDIDVFLHDDPGPASGWGCSVGAARRAPSSSGPSACPAA